MNGGERREAGCLSFFCVFKYSRNEDLPCMCDYKIFNTTYLGLEVFILEANSTYRPTQLDRRIEITERANMPNLGAGRPELGRRDIIWPQRFLFSTNHMA